MDTIHISPIILTENSSVNVYPKAELKGRLLYAIPGKWRIGTDRYEFKSRRKLSNGSTSPDYWTSVLWWNIPEKLHLILEMWRTIPMFGKLILEVLFLIPMEPPQFTDVWAP